VRRTVVLKRGSDSQHGKPMKHCQLTDGHTAHQSTLYCTSVSAAVRDAGPVTLGEAVPSDTRCASLLSAVSRNIHIT